MIFAYLLLSFNTVASTLLRSANQERINLVTEEEVLSDITKLIKKQLVFALTGRFRMFSLMHMNILPCSGFVKKSANIFCVGQNATFTSPFLILSVTKK